ncbi:unnamed protein product [Phytophthora fragariaefolia]|uniref:Unnamed protein product n=1 Tax=Phytophthora fragariaefolia TaxID=1490495 RepID=A0A9W6Y277_9STRA|nr:unnamed protein product [Phytophthora fragariaefolia]
MTPASAGLDAPQGAGLDASQGGEIDAPQAPALSAAQGTGLGQGHEEDRHHDHPIQQISGGLPHCRLTGSTKATTTPSTQNVAVANIVRVVSHNLY